MLLFTYGTLKQGHPRNPLLEDQKFLGKFHTKDNFQLFHHEWSFPCLVHPQEDNEGYPVYGEVYDIVAYADKMWKELDRIEGVPDLYEREEIIVKNLDGKEFSAVAYIFRQSVKGLMETPRCWPVGEVGHWYMEGKGLICDGESYRMVDIKTKEQLSDDFETLYELCDWCANNMEIPGGGKLPEQEWIKHLKHLLVPIN